MALGHTHSANFVEYSHLNLKDHKDTATDKTRLAVRERVEFVLGSTRGV